MINTTLTTEWLAAALIPQLKRLLSSSDPDSHEQRAPEYQLKPYALVIDDSADIAMMLVMILQHAGYDAVMAVSASDALELVSREHFDLVISDIGMPEMDGYALARAIRALPQYNSVPMIAVTGFDQYDDRQRALAAGFNTQVRKPIDPTKLVQLIQDLGT